MRRREFIATLAGVAAWPVVARAQQSQPVRRIGILMPFPPGNATAQERERAYKEVTAKAGKIPGLKGRWLAHAVDDPDAGYTMSLWADEAAMPCIRKQRGPAETILPHLKPFFSGDYTTTRCEVRSAEDFE